MTLPMTCRQFVVRRMLIACSALGLACGEGEGNLTEPDAGVIEITTQTSGAEPDGDGYSVAIDDEQPRPIGANASLRVNGITSGVHVVELSGTAANCAVGSPAVQVDVAAGETTVVRFSITCQATTGAVEVSVTTAANPDADGYQVLLDGTEVQPIAANGTVSLAGVASGSHLIGLTGVAGNCQVQGDNPRSIEVPAGQTVALSFVVDCAVPPPDGGTLEVVTVTTGPSPDPDGYAVALDGGAALALGLNARLAIPGLAPGTHSVALTGLAENCTIDGTNPREATVAAGETTEVAFAVNCAAVSGRLEVTVSGLPTGVPAAITVTGPNDYSQTLTATATLEELAPGSYTLTAASVSSGGVTYATTPAERIRSVAAGETVRVTMHYQAEVGSTLNLRIEALYLTQSTQTLAGDVPLIQGRDAYLRVFVVANEAGAGIPVVRVRFFDGSSETRTFEIRSPRSGATPTSLNEGQLGSSWNIPVPGDLIRPDLGVMAEVDPTNAIAEADEDDNRFPQSGARQLISVRSAAPLRIRLIPVRQQANDLTGNVSESNQHEFLDMARRLHPLPGYQVAVRSTYTTESEVPLDPNDMDSWEALLNEIAALRLLEGEDGEHYYGVVRLDCVSRINAVGSLGSPTAVGCDTRPDAARVLAHELGHNWDRLHTACGNPGDLDPDYPYELGQVGVYGLDVGRQLLKDRTLPDIMGYCQGAWIGDYTYRAIMDFRGEVATAARSAASKVPALLVRGRMVGGRAVLEPAFAVVARPALPLRDGSYTLDGLAADGSRVFGISFDPVPVADHPGSAGHFAFAVPLDEARLARLGTLRLTGPGAAAVRMSEAGLRGAGVAADGITARRAGRQVVIRWNASAHPGILIRDPESGDVLSFARGGRVEVPTGRSELDVVVSDGVRSRAERIGVAGP